MKIDIRDLQKIDKILSDNKDIEKMPPSTQAPCRSLQAKEDVNPVINKTVSIESLNPLLPF